MKFLVKNFVCCLLCAGATIPVCADTTARVASAGTNTVLRTQNTGRGTVVSGRSGNNNIVRSGTATTNTNNVARVARSAARGAVQSVRSGIINPLVRSASRLSYGRVADVSSGTLGRATAVFSDVSKIGSGYANCRDAYATCMDQFCAVANDKYRRCFCSSRFVDYRDTEERLSKAVDLLANFENNNLEVVDKTAAEVKAMYSATAGEKAVKKDTSAAANMLKQIDDLLSGKTSTAGNTGMYTSTNGSIIDFSVDIGDVFTDVEVDSPFATGGLRRDLSLLEGMDLYTAASKQCADIVSETCENGAVYSMSQTAYNVMITQDCNAYSKKIDSQREQVKQAVRTAEKYLREARLEEYRAHNSDDMNTCITAVRTAIQDDAVCGANYVKCLDNTGAYINSKGEPIYSSRLFNLNTLISLSGDVSDDVLKQNSDFVKFLDGKRKFANTALSTCRDIADDVWTEFKRTALIEIAQAQDEKIEEVKMSCVSTMAQCYDTQSSALKSFDDTTAKAAGAISVAAAREMCKDKVIACAALFGNTDGCVFDGNGNLSSDTDAKNCGITSLLSFVDTVDDVRVAEACDVALGNKLKELCTPDDDAYGYPYKCRLTTLANIQSTLGTYAQTYCFDKDGEKLNSDDKNETITGLMDDLSYEMDDVLASICEDNGGYWVEAYDKETNGTLLKSFYSSVYGGAQKTDWGRCLQYDVKVACEALNDETTVYGTYDASGDRCILSDAWYENMCVRIGGYWANDYCYIGGQE